MRLNHRDLRPLQPMRVVFDRHEIEALSGETIAAARAT